VRDRGISLANRLRKEHGTLEKQLSEAISYTLNRPASEEEIVKSKSYWEKMVIYHQENPFPTEEFPSSVEREMFEEMTGELFQFVEDLEVYNNYQMDLKTWEVDPETRALADFCIVLFNSNEFIYVY